jgi:hypothetical protein
MAFSVGGAGASLCIRRCVTSSASTRQPPIPALRRSPPRLVSVTATPQPCRQPQRPWQPRPVKRLPVSAKPAAKTRENRSARTQVPARPRRTSHDHRCNPSQSCCRTHRPPRSLPLLRPPPGGLGAEAPAALVEAATVARESPCQEALLAAAKACLNALSDATSAPWRASSSACWRRCRKPSASAADTKDCSAYARAMALGEADINRCPPGGAQGVARLAALTGQTTCALSIPPVAPRNHAPR